MFYHRLASDRKTRQIPRKCSAPKLLCFGFEMHQPCNASEDRSPVSCELEANLSTRAYLLLGSSIAANLVEVRSTFANALPHLGMARPKSIEVSAHT